MAVTKDTNIRKGDLVYIVIDETLFPGQEIPPNTLKMNNSWQKIDKVVDEWEEGEYNEDKVRYTYRIEANADYDIFFWQDFALHKMKLSDNPRDYLSIQLPII